MSRSHSRSDHSHKGSDSSTSSKDSRSEFIQYSDDGQPRITGYQYGPYAFMAPGKGSGIGMPQPAGGQMQDGLQSKSSTDELDDMPALPYLEAEAPLQPLQQPQTTIMTVSGSSYPRFSASPTPGHATARNSVASQHMEIDTALATARPLPTTSPLTARGNALQHRQDSTNSVLSRTQSSESMSSGSHSHTRPSTAQSSRAVSRQSTAKSKAQRSRANSTVKSGRATPIKGRSASGFATPRTARSTIFGGGSSESDHHTQHPPLPANYSANAAVESHFLYDSKHPEDDDYMHDPAVERPGHNGWLYMVGPLEIANVFTVALISIAVLGMFCAYPVVTEIRQHIMNGGGFFGLGGTNSSGQVPGEIKTIAKCYIS